MKKLIGGYDAKIDTCRIYDFEGTLVTADGLDAPDEIMERLAIYMTAPWIRDEELKFRFFKHSEEDLCECVVESGIYEAFVCGYGATEGEAFKNCTAFLCDLKEKYIDSVHKS